MKINRIENLDEIEEMDNIKVKFYLRDRFGYEFKSSSILFVGNEDKTEIQVIGQAFNTFVQQAGYYRTGGDMIFMEAINEDEYQLLADTLAEYRQNKKSKEETDNNEHSERCRYTEHCVGKSEHCTECTECQCQNS